MFRSGSRGAGLGALLLLAAAGCDAVTLPVAGGSSVSAVVGANAELSTFASVLRGAPAGAVLDGEGEFTVFAPTNSAFALFPDGLVDALKSPENAAILEALVGLHIVPQKVTAAELRDGQSLRTLSGKSLTISVKGGLVSVNGVKIRTTDIEADNGVIHTVDGVFTMALTAMQLAAILPELSSYVEWMNAAELELGDNTLVTVFAPLNSAFEQLDASLLENATAPAKREVLRKILRYHLLSGRFLTSDMQEGQKVATVEGGDITIAVAFGRRVNEHNLVATDIRVANGVIHLLDGVLIEHLDILDKAALHGLDGFVEAVRDADDGGLTSALRWGYLTVFAPTDAAWASWRATHGSDPADLAAAIRRHTSPGGVTRSGLTDGRELETLAGETLVVRTANGPRIHGGGGSVAAVWEVGARNGFLHAVDGVLPVP